MATIMAEVSFLSNYLNVPQPDLQSIVDTPTSELVKQLLAAVGTRAREHGELVSDKMRLEIELENAIRTSESRCQGLKLTADKALNEATDLRRQLSSEESARADLDNELQRLKQSSSTSSSEVDTLRLRITTLETSNRETIAILESKSRANDELAQDLQKQHQKSLQLSGQINALQQSSQSAASAASSAKFREQSLSQELEQAKRNNEWYDTELKTKSAEALKYRKEKGARIAELQRLNDEATANISAAKRTESALRTRLDEIQKKAEEHLSKVQQLQEVAAVAEEGFRQELESASRLADLRMQQTETHRNRVKEVEAALEKAKDDATEEIILSRQEAEAESQERQRLETRVSELEAEVDRLMATAHSHPPSVPGTPRQGLNGSLLGRASSPAQFGTPGSARARSTVTATQAIEELFKTKNLLSVERKRNERLSAEMEDMMQGLEAKQPEIEELQREHEQLQSEVVEMSKFVDQAGKDRDRAKKDVQRAMSEARTATAESNILQQQLRDMSAQIKMLLFDSEAREQGLESLSVTERAEIEQIARGEVNEGSLEGLSDTDRYISQRLVVFRNVKELEEKNLEMLKLTRQLGARMESEEALAAKNQAVKDHQHVQELEKAVEKLQDDINSITTRSESYIKERDMFRRMLENRSHSSLNPGSSLFGHSLDANVIATTENNNTGKDEQPNYAVMVRELQSHFDQYRAEEAVDRNTLKEQISTLAEEKRSIQSEISKISSQLTLANERYDMLRANYSMLQNENVELQKRSQILSESAAKQDVRTQQVAEDLIESKAIVESMRNENANLKVEKKFWKEIQDRLVQDNELLTNERGKLNQMIADQQNIQNQRELLESETRRRLQSHLESLETDLGSTKRKLNDEIENSKNAQLRKEYDGQQNQKRIDELKATIGSLKEELVAAKTSRDFLQARVDELTIELKSAEERVEVLQPRPTPRPGVQVTVDGQLDSLSTEQGLAIEVSELKRDLELSKTELENYKSQMEQYKEISQAAEEELQSFNETHDQYRQEMDSIIEEKTAQMLQHVQQIEDLVTELATTNTDLNAVRHEHGDITRHAAEEKTSLEAAIARLQDESERHATAASLHRQDLRAQAEIATKAQQDYEHELVKHAEAAKSLQSLRAEHNQLRAESTALKAEADAAKVTLKQSQASWEERREQFENELNELRTRRDDINGQNRVLLEQLEAITAQVSSLQQRQSAFADDSTTESSPTETDRSLDGLRELVTYLRRDKEIVDVQYELSVQEAKRLRQQLEYAQSQLNETRLRLDQERRSHVEGSNDIVAHKDLMDKLNELNLFRESNITLRNEAQNAQAQLSEKSIKVEELLSSIQPLETKVHELENAKEMQDGEIRLLQEDRDRWQKRNQDILSKYDRIDPAEMEKLKENLAALQSERDLLSVQQQPLQDKIQVLEAEKEAWGISRGKIVEQAKERSRVLTKEKNDRIAERDTAVREKEDIEQQLSATRQSLESAVHERQKFEERVSALEQELSNSRLEIQRVSNDTTLNPTSENTEKSEALTKELASLRQDLENTTQQRTELDRLITTIRQELIIVKSERDQAVASSAQLAQVAGPNQVSSDVGNGQEAVAGNQLQVSNAEREVLTERAIAAEAKATELENNMESIVKERSDKMKAILNKRLADSKNAQRAELEAEYVTRLEQDKAIWLAENTASVSQPNETNQPASSNTAGPPTPTTKVFSTSLDMANVSDQQLRELLSSHSTAKAIVRDNVKRLVSAETAKAKEAFERDSAEELAKKLAEAEKRAEEVKEQAVLMTTKKSSLQLNMAQNKEKMAAAKLQVVEKAANETPQRPVVEVWEIAKIAKPPPPPVASNPVPTGPAASQAPTITSEAPVAPTLSTKEESFAATPQISAPSANGTSSLPTPIVSAPTQPATRIPSASGIPRGGGAVGRGGGRGTYQVPRGQGGVGRGEGRGRGGLSNRGGANLNAGAQSFNPGSGNKRPHDENQAGQTNGPKRIRGGGGGGQV